MPRSTWLIYSSTSHLVLFISRLGLLGVYCVINIYRNYCKSRSPFPLPTFPIHAVLVFCIGHGNRCQDLTICQALLVPSPSSHYHHHLLIALFPLSTQPATSSLTSLLTPSLVALPLTPSPMQYYISGTIAFLIIEMTAQFAYYRYINKHGGGTSSLIFLFVIATLSAARNSLSFFLLLIVCMGLSVVTQDLGGVMGRVRALTAGHFVFGGKSPSRAIARVQCGAKASEGSVVRVQLRRDVEGRVGSGSMGQT
jgi:hypothetical protein